MTDFYINRTLHSKEQLVPDHVLLQETGVILVLAEPGAGKTEFLKYLSRGFGLSPMQATIFRHANIPTHTKTLVVDGLDEVARIDETGTDAIFVKARDIGATTIIFASRSYVWDDARTQFIRNCFGLEPKVIRLEPFDRNEQKQLFEAYMRGEDFSAFIEEAERFELTPLLGNPQFLQLFADAYVQGGRRFTTKRQIFIDAVNRLASERSTTVNHRNRPPIETIVDGACEIFSKLLLSGAAGVSASEQVGDSDYPYLQAISSAHSKSLPFVLDTRLFKPTANTGKHEPVHRIVAEYCAARYLVARIDDPGNTLSLRRCLALIAPNSAVRDELRGMLGWMAALGSRSIQEAVIDLDPYAVLANGDPSQLLTESKRRLLQGLKALANTDPYFRRNDAWRRFSVTGFFTQDIVDELRHQLSLPVTGSHLRNLLLELIQGSAAVVQLNDELRTLMLDAHGKSTTRLLAHRSLIELPEHDHLADFDTLILQHSMDSLSIASQMVLKKSIAFFGPNKVLDLLRALATLYPTRDTHDRTVGSRYFIRQFIGSLKAADVQHFLNELTKGFVCVCGKPKTYQCRCHIGISKIAGLLLDRYFDSSIGPHNPQRIWVWIKPLVFRGSMSVDGSPSVQALVSDDGLRQAIQKIKFVGKQTSEEMHEASQLFYQGHAGLHMRGSDLRVILDYAFETENTLLWKNFIIRHNHYAVPKGENPLRAHMRDQARQSPKFLRVWSKFENDYWLDAKHNKDSLPRSSKRYELKEKQRKEAHFEYLRQNRGLIESGNHWNFLKNFALYYLSQPEKFDEIVDDPQVAERALLNCFAFLAPHVPSLADLAEGKGRAVTHVLHAACLATYRATGTLNGIDIQILRAVKTDSGGYSGYRPNESELFEAELDRLLFPTDDVLLDFAREYIEPQLARGQDAVIRVEMLNNKLAFHAVRASLSLDWLTRYPAMPIDGMRTLFNICALVGDNKSLCELVAHRCIERDLIPADTDEIAIRRRKFWLLRHFFFVTPMSHAFWKEFSSDANSIFDIEHIAGRFDRQDAADWPKLTADKVYTILDTYVTVWPKVHLPNSYGSGSPKEETAYRFLTDIVSQIGADDPASAIPVLDRVISDKRFADFQNYAKSLKAEAHRKRALSEFSAPKPQEIVKLLNENNIASVEDMRALMVDILSELQMHLRGAATDPVGVFYPGGTRVDENTARSRIVDMLEPRLNALNLAVVIEHQMASAKRCDITASTSINGRPILLVTEVKGQWNPELYTAASVQLAERYMIYPGAAQQGIYLVLWFGREEKIAGKKDTTATNPAQLQDTIIQNMPAELRGIVDVVVLDLSRPLTADTNSSRPAKPSRKHKVAIKIT